jgi:hypothetical protein
MAYFIVNWGDAARISRAQGLLMSICIWARTLRTLYDWAKMRLLPLAPSVKLMYTFPHQDESAVALSMPPFGPVPPGYRGRRLRVPGRGDAPRHFHLSRRERLPEHSRETAPHGIVSNYIALCLAVQLMAGNSLGLRCLYSLTTI